MGTLVFAFLAAAAGAERAVDGRTRAGRAGQGLSAARSRR